MMKKKTVLVIAILTVLILTSVAGIATACPPAGGDPLEHIASDLCSINSSIKLLTYAVIALVLVQLIGLIPLFKKK